MSENPSRLLSNIAVLKSINNKPIPPTVNELVPRSAAIRETIILQSNQELALAECLTYLSAYSDNPEKVMALCVEEQPGQQGLLVSVAINSGSTRYLQNTVKRICEVIEAEAKCAIVCYRALKLYLLNGFRSPRREPLQTFEISGGA